MPVHNRIMAYQDDLTAWRRHLHQHPELLFETHKTAAFVAEKLRAFGVDEVIEGVGRAGVIGVIKGQGPGEAIGLRADMDALPIQEVRDLPHKSKTDGVMHACGHDGHTTMLLGAARYLAETRNFSGSVVLIFQPAEEGGGGAKVMVDEGVLDRFNISQVYALHNWPGIAPGALQMRPGPTMAAADSFEITVIGRGGHAAMPQACIDPVLIAAQIVVAAQSLVAREVDPREGAVLSICKFEAGSTHNVIPGTATLLGTVRTLSAETRDLLERRLGELAAGIATAAGGQAEIDYRRGYPTTVSAPESVAFAASVAAEVVGADLVESERPPEMGSEDFSYMLQERPGAYVYIGQGESAGLHNAEYDFNDEIAPVGASFFAALVEHAQPVR